MKVKALLLSLAFPAVCFAAEPMYLNHATDINASPDKNFLGTVSVLTPVTVEESKDGFSKVRVQGWSLKEYPSQIFAKPGVRIEYASFDEESQVKPIAGKETVTVQGNPWIETYAEGWVKDSVLTADSAKLLAEGKAQQQQNCSICHPAPAANHFTANQWASILPLKGGRAGHTRAKGNALLFKYLQLEAKQ